MARPRSAHTLDELIAKYEQALVMLKGVRALIAAPLPLPLSLTNGNGNGNGHGHVPDAFDAAYVAHENRKEARKAMKRGRKKAVPTKVRRAMTAELLAMIAKRTAPTPADEVGRRAGSLLRRGYLVKKAKGYVRTSKPFVP